MNLNMDKNDQQKNNSLKNQTDPDKQSLKELLNFMENTDLELVQIEKNGKKIVLRRSSSAAIKNQKNSQENGQLKEKEKESETIPVFSIRSPIVGRFYSSMGRDLPALAVEGGRVTAGQKVAIVEAMKIKKEVFSAYTGKVSRILVRDGDPVEYGQELFQIVLEEENENKNV